MVVVVWVSLIPLFIFTASFLVRIVTTASRFTGASLRGALDAEPKARLQKQAQAIAIARIRGRDHNYRRCRAGYENQSQWLGTKSGRQVGRLADSASSGEVALTQKVSDLMSPNAKK